MNDTVLPTVLIAAGALAKLYTFAPCWKVTAHTTLPLPVLLCRTKLTLTVDPCAKVVVACPAAFVVCAVLLITAWLGVTPLVPPTVK